MKIMRVSGFEFGESSTVSTVELFGSSVGYVGFESNSDEDVNVLEGIDLQAEDDFRLDQAHDDDTSIHLCWDSLYLDNHRETNEDFKWEEMDGVIDEREVLNMVLGLDEEEPIPLLPVGEPVEVDVEEGLTVAKT